MYKNVKIVMLPSNKRTDLVLHKDTGILEYVQNQKSVEGETQYFQCQNLYFLSNEEIKEGDYTIYNNQVCKYNGNRSLSVVNSVTNEHYPWASIEECKKIIATTDRSIGIIEKNPGKIISYQYPHPSDEFLQKYCELDGIDEVLVEYTQKNNYIAPEAIIDYGYEPIIAPDNTIITHLVKQI